MQEYLGDDTRHDEDSDNELAFRLPLKWDKYKKPLSWSAINSFRYDKKQWYAKYVLGEITVPSKEMEFGSYIGKRLETEEDFMPEIPRCMAGMEYKIHCDFDDVQLLGYVDSFDEQNLILHEYKTSSNKKKWNQKSVDEHEQLTMYLLGLYITKNIYPEDVKIFLHYIPVRENGAFKMEIDTSVLIQHFETKRNRRDIIKFGVEIKKTIKEMEKYVP